MRIALTNPAVWASKTSTVRTRVPAAARRSATIQPPMSAIAMTAISRSPSANGTAFETGTSAAFSHA